MLRAFFWLLISIGLSLSTGIAAEELRFMGALGNSGGDDGQQVLFDGAPAPGMGPALDSAGTLWERGGSRQLLRYSLDGRVLAKVPIPESTESTDQLTVAGETLVMKLRRNLYALPLQPNIRSQVESVPDAIDVLSSSSFKGRVAVLKQKKLYWFEPGSNQFEAIADCDRNLQCLHVTNDGQLFGFGGGEVFAWRDGNPIAGFPQGFHYERPQKLGSHWYAHTWHGTIHRMNERFEPDPGVVLGGASGSFIGYLPQSAELTNGRGMVQISPDCFAVSGMGGVVQLLTWNHDEQRFKLARRFGALQQLKGVAIDGTGNIWTALGSWRWNDSAEVPATEGDREADIHAQPVMLDAKRLCVLKKHYSYVQLATGPCIDASGWSHLDTPGLKDFELDPSVTGAALVSRDKDLRLVFVQRGSEAYSIKVNDRGLALVPPEKCLLPGLANCNSLAWFAGHLYASDGGALIKYQPADDSQWKEVNRSKPTESEKHLHSDGKHLVISDRAAGTVQAVNSSLMEVARYDGLQQPKQVAISQDRLVVYEAGRQRLVKLQLVSEVPSSAVIANVMSAKSLSIVYRPSDEEYIDLSRPAGLPCSVAVKRDQSGLHVSLRTLDANNVGIVIGIANGKQAYRFTEADVKHDVGQYDLRLPVDDWSSMQLAVAIHTSNQQERFGFCDHQPIHAPFSSSPSDWADWNFDSFQELIAARREEIRLGFDQPQAGKATLVIENVKGERVRNLFAGRSFTAGKQTVIWDGLDDQGRLVPPGEYRWRGITHSGISPHYRMNFANGGEATVEPWGPNHSTLQDAAANSKHVFFAAPVTEGGWALLSLDNSGKLIQGYDHQHGYGIQRDAVAADETYLYCAQDGFAWGGSHDINEASPDWSATWNVTLVRYEIATGKLVEYADKQRGVVIDSMQVGPGSKHPDLDQFNLAGMAVKDGKLYIGSRDKQAVLVVDAASGKRLDAMPLAGVRKVAVGNHVYAATDQGVVVLNAAQFTENQPIKTQPWPATKNMDLTGVAIDSHGDVWVSDRKSHQIHRFQPNGQWIESLGTPGGPYKGKYDPERLVYPAGLAFGPDGKLWVTEDRWNPKRVSAWDLSTRKVVFEKFGMPHYGGDGSGFDPVNPRRWIGLGCFWDVNIDKQTARPTHVLSIDEGHLGKYHPHSYSFFREAGRTFVSARGKIALISEVLEDGTLHDLVAISDTHHFAYAFDWAPPQSYIDAFYAKWPDKRSREKPGRIVDGRPWAQRGMGVLWVDRNGDGQPQQAEFDFCGDQIDFAGGAWGHLQNSLTLTVPLARNQHAEVLRIAPRNMLPNGTPEYPSLDETLTQTIPISMTPGYKRNSVATCLDRFGRMIFNSDPEMNAYRLVAPTSGNSDESLGKSLWTYPNQWSDVHGSHDSPLPEPGVMQGLLAILGTASLDDQADVMFFNGNHGRCYLMTTDGLYLDEAFVDVRVSYQKNEYRLGGEIFGGSFGRSDVDGKYFVQIGHGPYRIYELTGLDSVQRISGTFQVTGQQILAAQQTQLRRIAKRHEPKEATVPGTIAWDRSGKFKTEVQLAADGKEFKLSFRVEDSSPWINSGRDWTKLFATGDTIDLQFSTHATGDPQRRSPVAGDKRLVIAPYEGKNIAVLYDYRNPAGTNPIEFTSPWRGEKVDHVEQLMNAKIEVEKSNAGYQVNVSIPWHDLGWQPQVSQLYQADFGVTYGDAAGTDTNLRSYWSNPSTGLVDDIPGEVMLSPNLWGSVRFSELH